VTVAACSPRLLTAGTWVYGGQAERRELLIVASKQVAWLRGQRVLSR
jgi:hypothetical protein